jgi:pyruvate,water dikinase
MSWYDAQKIDPAEYTIEFVPHMETNKWATIMVVNDSGIFGEIVNDGHYILTQGFDGVGTRHTFTFDFKNWNISPKNDDALAYLKDTVKYLKIGDSNKRNELSEKLQTEFAGHYMKGYFETVCSEDMETWFIDYDRILASRHGDYLPSLTENSDSELHGQVASSPTDKVIGRVKIVNNVDRVDIEKDEILVCKMTSPDYIPIMQKALAIVTDQGGILCHAAIVTRELNKPCIVATGNATELLSTGERIVLDLKTGAIIR